MVASHRPPTGDLAHNPGMCPDWESTSDLVVRRPVLNPLNHTNQGSQWLLIGHLNYNKLNKKWTYLTLTKLKALVFKGQHQESEKDNPQNGRKYLQTCMYAIRAVY